MFVPSRRDLQRMFLGGMVLVLRSPQLAAAANPGAVFTADEDGRSVSAIALETGRVSSIPLPVAPHNIDAVPGRRMLLTVGAMQEQHGAPHGTRSEGAAGRLIVLESATDGVARIVRTIVAGEHPAHVVPDRAGQRAFVTDSGSDSLLAINLSTERIEARVRVGRGPHGMRLSPDGAELWIANTTEGSVSIVDVGRFREAGRIPVGPGPIQVGFLPDGSRVHVTLAGADAVAELDRATRQVRRRIPVGPGPAQLFAVPGGQQVLVANQGTRAAPGTGVSVIDTGRGAVIKTLTTGRGAHGVSVTADGTRAFITNMFEDTVSEIDVAQMVVVRRFAVGRSPNGVTWLGSA